MNNQILRSALAALLILSSGTFTSILAQQAPAPVIQAEQTLPQPPKNVESDDASAKAEKAKIEREKAQIGLEKERIALEQARISLRNSQLDLLKREQREATERATEEAAFIYTFDTGVNETSVKACIAKLGSWARQKEKAYITIILNSPGGSVIDGLQLYDYIVQLRASGHHITIVTLGYAASMGSILLQAADRRIIGPNAFVLIHEVSWSTSGKTSEMQNSVEFMHKMQERLLEILAERSTMTPAQIAAKWEGKDWWLNAKEVLKLGFADEILGAKPGVGVINKPGK